MFDIESILRQAAEEHMKKLQGEPYKNKDEALKELKNFIDKKSDIKVGDRIERNEIGKNKYTQPGPNSVAICCEVFKESILTNSDMTDIRMVVAVAKDNFHFYNVDSRYYRKTDGKANVFEFKAKN